MVLDWLGGWNKTCHWNLTSANNGKICLHKFLCASCHLLISNLLNEITQVFCVSCHLLISNSMKLIMIYLWFMLLDLWLFKSGIHFSVIFCSHIYLFKMFATSREWSLVADHCLTSGMCCVLAAPNSLAKQIAQTAKHVQVYPVVQVYTTPFVFTCHDILGNVLILPCSLKLKSTRIFFCRKD